MDRIATRQPSFKQPSLQFTQRSPTLQLANGQGSATTIPTNNNNNNDHDNRLESILDRCNMRLPLPLSSRQYIRNQINIWQ